jgi:DNA-binding transcriptional regulator LsrR (DeoR family)
MDVRLDWPFTQSELAAMVGGTRQSVNRLLVDLSARGLIRIEGDVLIIPDVERLARTVER